MKLPRGLVLPLAAGFAPVLLALVLFFEGMRLEAYRDSGGVWTICAGHTAGVRQGARATYAQCMDWLWQDLAGARASVDRLVEVDPGWLCRVALVDFVFNLGDPAFRRSTLLVKINGGDRLGAADEFLRWVYVGGRDCRLAASNCPGIVIRRQVARELCLVAP